MMSEQLATSYQPLSDNADDDTQNLVIHLAPEGNKAKWNHIEDLDSFFHRIYQYSQKLGFFCCLLEEMVEVLKVVIFALLPPYLYSCVNYSLLSTVEDVSIFDALQPLGSCISSSGFLTHAWIIAGSCILVIRILKAFYACYHFYDIKEFYRVALRIADDELANFTWHAVQERLLEAQQVHQMCLLKKHLTPLDVHNRILRFKNYMVAMVNKDLLPMKIYVPFIGERYCLTNGLKWNYEFLLFWGPWSPWQNNWHLKEDYKKVTSKEELAASLTTRCRLVALCNLIFAMPAFFYGIIYLLFSYSDILKREPGLLGTRQYSLYGRLYTRHFNELDHEQNARLCRGYKAACRYMDSFTTPYVTITAKFFAFVGGIFWLWLLVIGFFVEDVLRVEHYVQSLAVATFIVTVGRSLIPDEYAVWHPEQLLTALFAHLHYLPFGWKVNAHTREMMNKIDQIFEYKAVYILQEMLSPLLTPYFLWQMSYKSSKIVEFYRNFTVDIAGVGDVCSFAQMNVGSPGKVPSSRASSQQAENGKIELSLLHFTLHNPEWQPPRGAQSFLQQFKNTTDREMAEANNAGPLLTSLHSAHSIGDEYSTAVADIMKKTAFSTMDSYYSGMLGASLLTNNKYRGGVNKHEGPITEEAPEWSSALISSASRHTTMGLSALYLHQLNNGCNSELEEVNETTCLLDRASLHPT